MGLDIEFWGYAATSLVNGQEPIQHPPLLPLLAATAHDALGTGVLWPLWLLALLPGALLPPALAWVGARLDGPETGWTVGLLALLLPATTLSSLMVDSTALANLWLATLLGLSLLLARGGGPPIALLLGLVGGLAMVTKEGGVLDLVLLALPAVVMAPSRRLRIAALIGISALVVSYGMSRIVPELGGGKAALPVQEMVAWVRAGTPPSPITHAGERAWHLTEAEAGLFESMSLTSRLLAIAAVQLLRQVQFLGPYLLLPPLLFLAWRRRASAEPLPSELGRVFGLRLALLAGGLGLVIQGRHAEWLALPSLLLLAALLRRVHRAWTPVSFGLLLLFTGQYLVEERPRLMRIVAKARTERAVARWVEQVVPDDRVLVSPILLVGAATMRPVGQGVYSPLPPVESFLVLLRDETGHQQTSSTQLPEGLMPLAERARLSTPDGIFTLYEGRSSVEGRSVDTWFLGEGGTLGTEIPRQQRRKPQSSRDRGE